MYETAPGVRVGLIAFVILKVSKMSYLSLIRKSWAQLDELKHSDIKGRVIPVQAMKAFRVSGGVSPLILNLGTRWKSVVNFMPSLFFPGKEPRCALSRRLDGPRAILDFLEKRKISFP